MATPPGLIGGSTGSVRLDRRRSLPFALAMLMFGQLMNVSLGKRLEKLVEEQVKTGVYQDGGEVVRDALRHMFLEDDSDDTELLAQRLREAKEGPRKPYVKGEFRKLAARAVAAKRRQAKAA